MIRTKSAWCSKSTPASPETSGLASADRIRVPDQINSGRTNGIRTDRKKQKTRQTRYQTQRTREEPRDNARAFVNQWVG
jgi:hypothetical protein